MPRSPMPELKNYMDKRMYLQLNGSRKITGTLRGFDPFLNLVLDDAVEETNPESKVDIGMIVVRGNSVVTMEALERINNK